MAKPEATGGGVVGGTARLLAKGGLRVAQTKIAVVAAIFLVPLLLLSLGSSSSFSGSAATNAAGAALGGAGPPSDRAYQTLTDEGVEWYFEATAGTDVPWYVPAGLVSYLTKNGTRSPYPHQRDVEWEWEDRVPLQNPPISPPPSDPLGWGNGGCGPFLLNPHWSAAPVTYSPAANLNGQRIDAWAMLTPEAWERFEFPTPPEGVTTTTPAPASNYGNCVAWGQRDPWLLSGVGEPFNPQDPRHSLTYLVTVFDQVMKRSPLTDDDWLDEHDPQRLGILNNDAIVQREWQAVFNSVIQVGYTENWIDEGNGEMGACSEWNNGIYSPLRAENAQPVVIIGECPAPPLVPDPNWMPPPTTEPPADATPPGEGTGGGGGSTNPPPNVLGLQVVPSQTPGVPDGGTTDTTTADPVPQAPLIRDYTYIPPFGAPDYPAWIVNETRGLLIGPDGQGGALFGSGSLAGVADIPPTAAAAYEAATRAVADTFPECAMTPEYLAGFGKVESNHGRYRGATMDESGNVRLPDGGYILGVPLNGSGAGGNRTPMPLPAELVGMWGVPGPWQQAMGPMQFIPTTWRGYVNRGHADGNGDGESDPHNYFDAAFAAANYLCGARTDLTTEQGMWDAARTYNHNDDYADDVVQYTLLYRAAMQYGPGSGSPSDIVAAVPLVDIPCPTGGTLTVNAQIGAQASALLADAATDGLRLCGGGYRDSAQQIALRRAHCGTSNYAIYEMSPSSCRPPTARPGQSMHERGLAIDFTAPGQGNCSTRSTACFQWLRDNAARYGLFNLPSEPWHWSTSGG